jgi:hypothetical protein
MLDKDYRRVDRSVDALRKEHNRRVEDAARRRVERVYEQRQETLRQMVAQVQPTHPAQINALPAEGASGLMRYFRERLQRTGANLRLFHFTLQFGRLRIELVRASGQRIPGAPL